ncbi:MAG: hypothetical protein ACRDH5_14435, partial [bacterium]
LEQIGLVSTKALGKAMFYGLRHADGVLRENTVLDMLDTYLDNGGDIIPIRHAVVEALYSTGLWGKEALENYRKEFDIVMARRRAGDSQGNVGSASVSGTG